MFIIMANQELDKLFDDLNPEQKEAVTYGTGPLLVIAGAGTGKTTVITRRLAWLILSGKVKSDEILALTFTDKAAEEMEERVDKLMPFGYLDFWISTFHSFCQRILKNHALDIGLPLNFKLLNQTQQAFLIRQNFNRFDLDYYKPLGNPNKFIQSMVKHFSRAKDELISPENYLQYAEEIKLNKDSGLSDELIDQETSRLKEIAGAYQTYQQLLLENNYLDFGDLINYTIKLFRQRPNILEKYRQQFKYILVDEFQDTNWAQYELLKLLAESKKNLTVVGDDKQAIYRWRGAAYNNVLQFKKDYAKCKDIFLINNYRSRQEILDLAYQFIQLNYFEEQEKISELTPLLSRPIKATRPGQALIEHLHASTQEEEARKVVEKIIELKKIDSEASWNDFAILVRANDQAEIFCQALRWADLPHQFLASTGLYAKPIILDILAYLKLLDDYHESPALYRILTSPIFAKIKNDDLVNLTYWANRKNWSLYETLTKASMLTDISAESLNEINKLLGLIQKHTQLARQQSVGKVVYGFLEETGYLGLLTKQAEENQAANLENVTYLNQFFKKIEEFEAANADKSVKNFNQVIEIALEVGDEGGMSRDLESGPEAIKVMTIHGAKGLEFKYVFVVNLVDRRFPTIERSESIELPDALIKEIIPQGDIHLQEERRLFYVAMTRAKDGLFFTSAEDYGGLRKKKFSRFLYELGLVRKGEEAVSPKSEKIIRRGFGQEKIPSTIVISPPTKFSFSQIRAFETCPLQYKFGFILRIPRRGNFTFSFGQTIHQTLFNFFQQILERQKISQSDLFGEKRESELSVSLDELLKFYEKCWIDDWYQSKEHQEKYKEKGREILKNFYQEIKANPPNSRYLELDFNFKLEKDTIKGKIDRVDLVENNQIEIIDYKTGRAKGENLSSEDKEQLLIYQLAGQALFREKIKQLTYYYLDENRKVSFLGSEAEIDQLKNKIQRIIGEIKRGEFSPRPSRMCQFCDFKDVCEYRQL